MKEIDDYFSSIEDSFEKSLPPPKKKLNLRGKASGLLGFIAVLSIVPLIPGVVWIVIGRVAPHASFALGSLRIPADSYPFWWLVCVAIFLPTAILVEKWEGTGFGQDSKDRLGAAAMRFALCYSAAQEIDRYAKNRLPKHSERAMFYWRLALPSLFSGFDFGFPFLMGRRLGGDLEVDAPLVRYRRAGIGEQNSIWWVDAVASFHPWFRLAPETARIVEAFNSVTKKITSRLQDRKDLQLISGALRNLIGYLYLSIPEISSVDWRTTDETVALSETYLLRFSDALKELTPYSPEVKPLEGKARARLKFVTCVTWTVSLFSHENSLAKFCTWWVFSQGLVLISIFAVTRLLPALKLDSTLISLAIGTPLVVSAAALAGPLRKK
jgi:hypothetical protein